MAHTKPSFDVDARRAQYEADYGMPQPKASSMSRFKPKGWGKKAWIACVVITLVIILGAVLGGVLGSRAAGMSSSYPAYAALNYTLADTYAGTGFFDNFNYYTGYDPALGLVHYVPASYATNPQFNLTYASSSSAVVRVDTSSGVYNTTNGRYTVRLESKKQYNDGLFLFDISHVPYGCSTWPAIWLSDESNWPNNGEIDVIESVNQATWGNQATLHTTEGCTMNGKRMQTGTTVSNNCYNGTDNNEGCGVSGPTNSVGEAFNNIGGGVYAMEWRSDGIRVWFFERSSIPSNIPSSLTNTTGPDVTAWGEPMADFPNTNCDIGSHFKNASIIINIDLCGTWAGATDVYSTQDQCPGLCTNFVANNATAYNTAYWEINSIRVYNSA